MEELKPQVKIRKKVIPPSTEQMSPEENLPEKMYDLMPEKEAQYLAIKSLGVPVHTAVFHRTVNAYNFTPETAFYASGTNVVSRKAQMWFTPHGLLCEQNNSKHKIIVPLANVVYMSLL